MNNNEQELSVNVIGPHPHPSNLKIFSSTDELPGNQFRVFHHQHDNSEQCQALLPKTGLTVDAILK